MPAKPNMTELEGLIKDVPFLSIEWDEDNESLYLYASSYALWRTVGEATYRIKHYLTLNRWAEPGSEIYVVENPLEDNMPSYEFQAYEPDDE